MSHPFPSEPWTQAYVEAVNGNEVYRESGKDWTHGAVAMVVESDPSLGIDEDVAMILDVHEGVCRGAQYVTGQHGVQGTPFVIVADYAQWKNVIEGNLDPIKGMMEGKLRLTHGHLPTMIRFVESSRQLVVSAKNVPTKFADT